MRDGDETWVLAGANVPYILRSVMDDHSTLVGEAYMHDVMGGKIMKRSGKARENSYWSSVPTDENIFERRSNASLVCM